MILTRYAIYSNVNHYPPAQKIMKLRAGEEPPWRFDGSRWKLEYTFYAFDGDNIDNNNIPFGMTMFVFIQSEEYPYQIINMYQPIDPENAQFDDMIKILAYSSKVDFGIPLRFYQMQGVCCLYGKRVIFTSFEYMSELPAAARWKEMDQSPMYVFDRDDIILQPVGRATERKSYLPAVL